jgi:hypothetical protein
MTDQSTLVQWGPPPATKTTKRKLTHSQKAKQQGVSGRTLDRWIQVGIIEAPIRVNGRKYHNEDSQPRQDEAAA